MEVSLINNEYRIRQVESKDLQQMIDIFKKGYLEECLYHEKLPKMIDLETSLIKKLTHAIDKNHGWVITHNQIVVGYLLGFFTGPLFGLNNGVVVPLYGHGAIKESRSYIYQRLFNHVALSWLKKDIYSVAITMFAHDEETKDLWFRNGFGLRCVDACRNVEPIETKNTNIAVKKIELDTLSDIYSLHKKHNEFYRLSPMFMPNPDEDPKEDFDTWMKGNQRIVFAAYTDHKPVGYIRLQPDGESIVSMHDKMMNITGAYVDQAYRNKGVAKKLLSEVMKWLKKQDYDFCGVDYEAINPTGAAFWEKHFTPYTFSLTRRFDERIRSFINQEE